MSAEIWDTLYVTEHNWIHICSFDRVCPDDYVWLVSFFVGYVQSFFPEWSKAAVFGNVWNKGFEFLMLYLKQMLISL